MRIASLEFDTDRLLLRRWAEHHRAPFAALNADADVMRYFPSSQTRAQSDASIAAWLGEFDSRGWSNWAVELKEARRGEAFVGFVGLSIPRRVLPFSTPEQPAVEIGWRLARAHWGCGYASEAARECLRVGFERLALAEIVSFTALANARSRAVMERIGLRDVHEDFDHPALPEGHTLRRHCLYRISADEWRQNAAAAR